MNIKDKLYVVVSALVICSVVLVWSIAQYIGYSNQQRAEPPHREEQAEAPNLPKPPSFVERVLKDNPHITRQTAEAFENERIQMNIMHQEHRVQVLTEKNISDPEEMITLEQELARELQTQFLLLEQKYNVNMQQGKSGFIGAPVPPVIPN